MGAGRPGAWRRGDRVPPPPAGWNELLIASFSHRSIAVKDGILLATGLHVHRNSAHSAGVGAIFDRWGPAQGTARLASVLFSKVLRAARSRRYHKISWGYRQPQSASGFPSFLSF